MEDTWDDDPSPSVGFGVSIKLNNYQPLRKLSVFAFYLVIVCVDILPYSYLLFSSECN